MFSVISYKTFLQNQKKQRGHHSNTEAGWGTFGKRLCIDLLGGNATDNSSDKSLPQKPEV